MAFSNRLSTTDAGRNSSRGVKYSKMVCILSRLGSCANAISDLMPGPGSSGSGPNSDDWTTIFPTRSGYSMPNRRQAGANCDDPYWCARSMPSASMKSSSSLAM